MKIFVQKISDFGLAKLRKKKESIVSILDMRGTIVYIAPKAFSQTYGAVSHKSDMYSYGMLILEMVARRKNYDSRGSYTSEMYFLNWILRVLSKIIFILVVWLSQRKKMRWLRR